MRSKQQSKPSCGCSKSLPFSSAFLFLSLILPSPSFAQISFTQLTSTPAIGSGSVSSTTTPTSTRSSSSSTSSTSSTSSRTPRPTPTFHEPPPSSTDTSKDINVNGVAFHYYFLIIALVAVFACLGVLYLSRRKKRKAAMMRTRSQRALARDVEGFRTRLRGRTGLGWNSGTTQRNNDEEGLDERGEAPPPYMPGTKPPSLRSVSRDSTGPGEAVELRPMSAGVEHPPGYNEHVSEGSDASLRRPDTAVTASDRFGSMRRLISGTGSSSGQDGHVVR